MGVFKIMSQVFIKPRYASAVYAAVMRLSVHITSQSFTKTVKHRIIQTMLELPWKANRKSYVLYQMMLFPVTLGDL